MGPSRFAGFSGIPQREDIAAIIRKSQEGEYLKVLLAGIFFDVIQQEGKDFVLLHRGKQSLKLRADKTGAPVIKVSWISAPGRRHFSFCPGTVQSPCLLEIMNVFVA